jgi:GxxExxY protein
MKEIYLKSKLKTHYMYKRLSEREEYLATQIVDIAISIHKRLGPGLLESVYEKVFCYELGRRNIPYLRQREVPIMYDELVVDDGLRLDLLIDDLVIIELKAQENYHPVWEAQLLSYLTLTKRRLGLLINFHVPLMKNGIKRLII